MFRLLPCRIFVEKARVGISYKNPRSCLGILKNTKMGGESIRLFMIYECSLFQYRSVWMARTFQITGQTVADQFLMTFLPLMMYTPFFRWSVASDWRTLDLISSPATE